MDQTQNLTQEDQRQTIQKYFRRISTWVENTLNPIDSETKAWIEGSDGFDQTKRGSLKRKGERNG